jgi:8-oxo-dGTP pyrophosphatase MutT (NUDIX family)
MSKEGRDTNRVAAVLVKDAHDNVLMGLRNDSFSWGNPGGHLKVGECFLEGSIRELKEETGLDAKEVKLISMTKIGKYLVYLIEAKVDSDQKIDPSNDPDQEAALWDFVDPNDVCDNLHIPLKDNVVLKHWML